ncbi:uncharacterized protein LOC111371544 isoform X2 [Olea europaea var. sylvestris]|uniref:uncharacterized protein LOC111371544 isoform X2 n=1 Tax=Olea europaea var. sylvestris TaxID=158386 RepID=UPI000C1D0ED2|nr:uncharacterized protein LOC111371544 isoform X2 [Olea europaea var. sylvestris]XP_022849359.1 uncharacterized protein LOC111371544 isoform X2 [Olea europaea var. sylvestris]
MATSSEAHKQGSIQIPGSILRNGNSVPELNNGAVPTLKYQKQISTEWAPEEQSILEEGLAKYATHSMIVCYAKIAVQLKKKTVCDVALRCRWMTVKEASKRGKGDLNVRRKSKDRGSGDAPSFLSKISLILQKAILLAIQQDLPPALEMVTNYNKDGTSYNGWGHRMTNPISF